MRKNKILCYISILLICLSMKSVWADDALMMETQDIPAFHVEDEVIAEETASPIEQPQTPEPELPPETLPPEEPIQEEPPIVAQPEHPFEPGEGPADALDEEGTEMPAEEPEGFMPPGEDAMPQPEQPGAAEPSLQLHQQSVPSAMPGEALDFHLYIEFLFDAERISTNTGADGTEKLPYADEGYLRYSQSVAERVEYAKIFFPKGALAGPEQSDEAVSIQSTLIENGVNQGYAVVTGINVPEDAEPGVQALTLSIVWKIRDQEMNPEHELERSVQATVFYEVLPPGDSPLAALMQPWENGVIVYSHAELIEAITNTTYTVIYLGYNDTNQGVIAYERLQGIPINRSLVIDGIDPLTDTRMHLRDWNSNGPLDGMYANASGISVTIRNMDITGHNFYGVVYGTGRTNVSLRYENVSYQGRQIAHNAGSGSRVTFAGCNINITNIGSGTEQEVVEAPNVVFSGSNTVSRSGPTDLSMVWLYGDTNVNLTIESGASVTMATSNYLLFPVTSTGVTVDIYGSLDLTTNGPNGSFTYGELYVRRLTVHGGGRLNVNHNDTARPTIQADELIVHGTLTASRNSSSNPVIRLQAGGRLTCSDPALVRLDNPGSGGVIRSLGAASITWSAPVVNRYSGGQLVSIWNNRDLSAFVTNLSINGSSASVSSTSLENGARGAAIGSQPLSGSLPLGSDTRLVIGPAILSLERVYGGYRDVSGSAAAGASVTVAEYAYESGSLGGLIQQKSTVSSGGFAVTLDAPIRLSGSRVYAISDDGVLVCHTYQDTSLAGPLFLSVPETLVFETTRLSSKDQLIPREKTDWAIAIFDARVSGNGFALYARIDAPLTAPSGNTLSGGLVFVKDQEVRPLSGHDLLIAQGSTDDGIYLYSIGWDADEGLIARLPAFEGTPDEPYQALITWTLVEGP